MNTDFSTFVKLSVFILVFLRPLKVRQTLRTVSRPCEVFLVFMFS